LQDHENFRFNHVESDQYIKVIIEGTIGDGEQGDIAIDDLQVTRSACGKQ